MYLYVQFRHEIFVLHAKMCWLNIDYIWNFDNTVNYTSILGMRFVRSARCPPILFVRNLNLQLKFNKLNHHVLCILLTWGFRVRWKVWLSPYYIEIIFSLNRKHVHYPHLIHIIPKKWRTYNFLSSQSHWENKESNCTLQFFPFYVIISCYWDFLCVPSVQKIQRS